MKSPFLVFVNRFKIISRVSTNRTFIIRREFCAIIFITYRSTATSSEVYTRDVKKIEDAFEAVQQGNLDVSLNIDSSKEFQTIGNDFNEMLDGLKKQIEQNK